MEAHPIKKPSSYLSSIVQRKIETLKANIQRFTEEMMQVNGYIDDRVIEVMHDRIQDEDFI